MMSVENPSLHPVDLPLDWPCLFSCRDRKTRSSLVCLIGGLMLNWIFPWIVLWFFGNGFVSLVLVSFHFFYLLYFDLLELRRLQTNKRNQNDANVFFLMKRRVTAVVGVVVSFSIMFSFSKWLDKTCSESPTSMAPTEFGGGQQSSPLLRRSFRRRTSLQPQIQSIPDLRKGIHHPTDSL